MSDVMTKFAERALRAAVNVGGEAKDGSNAINSIKDMAMSRLSQFMDNKSGKASSMAAPESAIAAALVGLGLAYSAISDQINTLKSQRLSFDKERIAGIATFVVLTGKEERDLSREEKVILDFISLEKRYPEVFKYSGIKSSIINESIQANYYSVLPYYKMSNNFRQPVSSNRPVDRQRTAISSFFQAAIPSVMKDIDTDFQSDWRIKSFFESSWEKQNYLNDLRAPRLIMMALANIMWNLQHPVDPANGRILTTEERIKLCRDTDEFLNNILNVEQSPYINEISDKKNNLVSFVRKVESHIKALHQAYVHKSMHELDIPELKESTHHMLRVMDTNLFKIIYRRKNKISGKYEVNTDAATSLHYYINFINQLVSQQNRLTEPFNKYISNLPENTYVNNKVTTVIDILIVFCHLPKGSRKELIEVVDKIPGSSADELADILKKFNKQFIEPVEYVSNKQCGASKDRVKILTGSRLIPLITLLVADFGSIVDLTNKDVSTLELIRGLRGSEQVACINKSAMSGHSHYKWELSPYMHLSIDTAHHLDLLPQKQYRLTQTTKLLDGIDDLVKNYQSFLCYPQFQKFLLNVLHRIDIEFSNMEAQLRDVDGYLSLDEDMSRTLKGILRPMTEDIQRCINHFNLAVDKFERVIGDPDFTQVQRQILPGKISEILHQFYELYSEQEVNLKEAYSMMSNDERISVKECVPANTLKSVFDFTHDYFCEIGTKLSKEIYEHASGDKTTVQHILKEFESNKIRDSQKLSLENMLSGKALLESSLIRGIAADPKLVPDSEGKTLSQRITDKNYKTSQLVKLLLSVHQSARILQDISEDKRQNLSVADVILSLQQQVTADGKKRETISRKTLEHSSFCRVILAPLEANLKENEIQRHKSIEEELNKAEDITLNDIGVVPSQEPIEPIEPINQSISSVKKRLKPELYIDTKNPIDSPISPVDNTKNLLIAELRGYINKKSSDLPLNWFQHILRAIVNLCASISNFIRGHTRETKLRVSRDLLNKLEQPSSISHAFLPFEQRALETGDLGKATIVARKNHSFWTEITSTSNLEEKAHNVNILSL